MRHLTRIVFGICVASLVVMSAAYPQSPPIHGRWQGTDIGELPPEIYLVLYLDTDGMERADIGELLALNSASRTNMRLLIATHGIVRRIENRNFILLYSDLAPRGDFAEFALRPDGSIVLKWLPLLAARDLQRLGHWPTDAEILSVAEAQGDAFRRRIELTPATKPFPDLN